MLAAVKTQWLGNDTDSVQGGPLTDGPAGPASISTACSQLLAAVSPSIGALVAPLWIGGRATAMIGRAAWPISAILLTIAAADCWPSVTARLLVAVLALLVVWLAKRLPSFHTLREKVRWYAAVRRVPTVSGGHWLLGQASMLRPDLALDSFRKWVSEHPRLLRLNRGPLTDFIVVLHPEAASTVLRSADNSRDKYIYSFLEPWLGDGLLTACEGDCRARRRPLLLAQGPRSRPHHARVFGEALENLFSEWDGECESSSDCGAVAIDVQAALRMLSLDIIVRCAFSARLNARCLSGEANASTGPDMRQYARTVPQLLRMTVDRMLTIRHHNNRLFWRSEQGQRYRVLLDQAHAFTSGVVHGRITSSAGREKFGDDGPLRAGRNSQETSSESCREVQHDLREARAPSHTSQRGNGLVSDRGSAAAASSNRDFLDILLDQYGHCEDAVRRVRNELDSLVFAGHDTTACALAWTLFYLSRFPDVQRRCQTEVDNAAAGAGCGHSDLGDEALCYDTMPYLTQCVKESLRFTSIIPHIHRRLGADCDLDGHRLLAGTRVLVSLWAIHHNPHVWPEPERFIPERFGAGSPNGTCPGHEACTHHDGTRCSIHTSLKNAFVPFSAGPRACLGQAMAFHEITTVLAMLLRRYDFSFHGDTMAKPQPTPMIVMHSANGIHLQIKKRTNRT